MSGAFAFLVQAGNAVNSLTGGLLMGVIIAFISSLLFITLVTFVVARLVNR